MRVSEPNLTGNDESATWTCTVQFDDGTERELHYCLPSQYRHFLSDRADAALAALLSPAMRCRERLYLDGPVSADLLHQVQTDYVHVLARQLPGHDPVEVRAGEVRSPSDRTSGVFTGFSAGIDSFATIADHYLGELPDELRISHLLYNNVGSHGSGGATKFWERYKRLRPVARELGLPFIPVDSNLSAFYEGSFASTHTPRNASVALLLQPACGRFLYSSAYGYGDVGVWPTNSMAHADPIALPLLSTKAVQLRSVGSHITRPQKAMRVAGIDASYTSLDVCIRSDVGVANCSQCWKCLRTLLTFDIGGVLAYYADSFNLELYRLKRNRYIASILASRAPLDREIVAFAHERGFAFPRSAFARMPVAWGRKRVTAARRVAPDWLKDAARKARRE